MRPSVTGARFGESFFDVSLEFRREECPKQVCRRIFERRPRAERPGSVYW